MSILLNSNLEPRGSFPLLSGLHGADLPKIVADEAARDAIPDAWLSVGTEIWCTGSTKKYRLTGVGPRVWTDCSPGAAAAAPAALYQVYPGCAFDQGGNAIQLAVNKARADGHTSNANPAIIDIYPKVGGWVGDIALLVGGVHLVGHPGAGIGQMQGTGPVVIKGRITWTPNGTLPASSLLLQSLQINAPTGKACFTPATAGGGLGRVLIRDCLLYRADAGDAITMTSATNGGSIMDLQNVSVIAQTVAVNCLHFNALNAWGCRFQGQVVSAKVSGFGTIWMYGCELIATTAEALRTTSAAGFPFNWLRRCRIAAAATDGIYIGNFNSVDAEECVFDVGAVAGKYAVTGAAGGKLYLGQCAYSANKNVKNVLTYQANFEAPALAP